MQSNASARVPSKASHVQGVDATPGGLVKATLGAALVAGAILTFVWLPAEFGIDPTGVGHVIGLTEMGEIKEQLHADADADAAAASVADALSPGSVDSDITQKLADIQLQLTAIAAQLAATTTSSEKQVDTQAMAQPSEAAQAGTSAEPAAAWLDEVDYTLQPGEGIEIKLVMDKGAVAEFEWSANGALVNHDTHGDGDGQSISYEKGRSVPEQAGELTAAFTGNHGWFWRNRTEEDVVVTLRARGAYKEMLLP